MRSARSIRSNVVRSLSAGVSAWLSDIPSKFTTPPHSREFPCRAPLGTGQELDKTSRRVRISRQIRAESAIIGLTLMRQPTSIRQTVNSSTRLLFGGGVLALMLTQCGTTNEHSRFAPGAGGAAGAGGSAGVIQLGEAGANGRISEISACAIGAIAEFETCPDDAQDGSACDGLAPACSLAGDAGASGVLLCATGVYPSVWNE